MGPRDLPKLAGSRDRGKGHKLCDIARIGLLGIGVIQVGEPLDLGRDIRKVVEVRKRKGTLDFARGENVAPSQDLLSPPLYPG